MRVLTAFLLFTSSSFAFSPPCQDFTGEWMGRCVNDGTAVSDDDNLALRQQACATLDVNEDRIEFGKDQVITQSLEDSDVRTRLHSEWNSGQTGFQITFETVATDKATDKVLYSAKGKLSFSREGVRLKTRQDTEVTTYSSSSSPKVEWIRRTCRYDRTQP